MDGSFGQTISGIKNLIKYGIGVVTNTVINKLNYKDLPRLALLVSDLDIHYVKMSFIRPLGCAERHRKQVFLRMRDAVPYVKSAAQRLIGLKRNFVIQEIPPCVMNGYTEYIRKGSKMPHIDAGRLDAGGFLQKYERGGNIKLTQCQKCSYDNICLGPWQEYVNYFGDGEFRPLNHKLLKGV